jgi:SAM-dependent methyltransferase
MHAVWRRAGIGPGHCVIDVACGSGRSTIELADLVGPSGRVLAFDLSPPLIDELTTSAYQRGLTQVVAAQADLNDADLGVSVANAVWCRWFAAFVDDPDALFGRSHAALVPGGIFISHEYLDFGSWRAAPPSAALDGFGLAVARAWGADDDDDADEPPDGFEAPVWLTQLGFDLIDVRPVSDGRHAGPLTWQWPPEFVEAGLRRLTAKAAIPGQQLDAIRLAFDEREAASRIEPAPPAILEVLARRRA